MQSKAHQAEVIRPGGAHPLQAARRQVVGADTMQAGRRPEMAGHPTSPGLKRCADRPVPRTLSRPNSTSVATVRSCASSNTTT